MAGKLQTEKLYQFLKEHPEGVSLQRIRNELFIMNPMQVKRMLNKKLLDRAEGEHVETFEMRRTSNDRPVNGYRLMHGIPVPAGRTPVKEAQIVGSRRPIFGMDYCPEHGTFPFGGVCPKH